MKSIATALLGLVMANTVAASVEPLPSWNDSTTRETLVEFVEQVTTEGGAEYVPPANRIAVFDNDGTLWAEQPIYFQAAFIFDQVVALASMYPDWKDTEPFASVLRGDLESALAGGKDALIEMLMATHAGVTSDEFEDRVRKWLEEARHPKTGRRYAEMVYQPMLELLDYLRANEFKTFIVSGGGVDFLRVFAEETYGIPPEQVIGTRLKAAYEIRDGDPVIVKVAELEFVDDKEGKPVGIYQHIGRRPIAAFGNSDGDFQMLEWTTARDGPSLGVLVHHDDPDRESAYDRDSHIGRLDRGLDEAVGRDWVIISMKDDWRAIFPLLNPTIPAQGTD